MLFYDKALSEDNLVSCANCHMQQFAFGSDKKLDIKVNHGMTTRNSSILFNLVYTPKFFWDGRTNDLESTVKDALEGEQKFNANFVRDKLFLKANYKELFKLVFNTDTPTTDMVAKAISSFIRTMVSANSAVDRGAKEGDPNRYLSADAQDGKLMFETEEADCFHCHGDIKGNPLMTDNLFHNNGLDSFNNWALFKDPGLGKVSSNQTDYGKFKTPPLRNLSYTAPFMHDGRIPNIDGVIAHYNMGLKNNVNIDPLMKKVNQGGLQLSPFKLAKLKAYLLSFDDPSFIADTAFSNPFK
jgi:cytochrome c peroxidase